MTPQSIRKTETAAREFAAEFHLSGAKAAQFKVRVEGQLYIVAVHRKPELVKAPLKKIFENS
jgi:hypothetical protein